MLKENVENILNEIKGGNNFNEPITLVAAIKTVCAEEVNRAIGYGIKVVAENKVQEFREKNDLIFPCTRHFIGHLQTNKVKYIAGKVDLIHSVDTIHLAEEINSFCQKRGIIQNILLEINAGGEISKNGFTKPEAERAVEEITEKFKSVKVKGLMAMMPLNTEQSKIADIMDGIRSSYDGLKKQGFDFNCLSMGMSGDYKLAIAHGSNTIRIGTALFGKRNYGGQV